MGKFYKKIFSALLCAAVIINMPAMCFAVGFNDGLPALDLKTSDINLKVPAGVPSYKNEDIMHLAELISKASSDTNDIESFNLLANKHINLLYSVYTNSKDEDIKDTIYFTALPAIWHNALLNDETYYHKIYNLYSGEFDLCLKNSKKCNYKKAGFALQIMFDSYNRALIDCKKISALLSNAGIDEEDRISFLQYAGPIMAVKGCKAGFEQSILSIGSENSYGASTSCSFDPFALVHAIDNSYAWIKETCSHSEGFWSGICARYEARKKPFLEYKRNQMPASVKKFVKDKDGRLLCVNGSNKNPYLYAASLRMYADFFVDEYNWEESFSFLMNELNSSDIIVSAAKQIALASLVEKMPAGLANKAEMKAYFAGSLHNAYFFLDSAVEADAQLKAQLKNELGSYYAKFTGYKGSSPIKFTSDEGFLYEMKFNGNEEDIESFLGSLFNFSQRPAEALMNINIIALVSKGGIKQVSKLGRISEIFSKSAAYFRNIPVVLARAGAEYRALKYLASKNSMSALGYGYKNMLYRGAANSAQKYGISMVEGKPAEEFFASSHYNKLLHGNIGSVASDINKAGSIGVKALGKGGSIPSFIPEERFGDISAYTDDFMQGQNGIKSIVSKYKGANGLVKSAGSVSSGVPVTEAAYTVPRKYLYSFAKSKYLPFVQDYSYSADYLLRDKVYSFLQNQGIRFFNIKTGAILPAGLQFHKDGAFLAKGLLGRIFTPSEAYVNGGMVMGRAGGLSEVAANTLKVSFNNLASQSIAGINKMALFAMPSILRPSLQYISLEGNPDWSINMAQSNLDKSLPAFLFKNNAAEKIKRSVFEINTDLGHGTGFYVEHHGAKFILTAAHVTKTKDAYFLTNAFGRSGFAFPVYKSNTLGEDLSILMPSSDLVKGIEPLKLSLKEPRPGSQLVLSGFPGKEGYTMWPQMFMGNFRTMFFGPQKMPLIGINEKEGYYMAYPASMKGFSGGPLISENGIVGLASSSDLSKYTYYVKLPVVKQFLTTAFKDLFLDPSFDKNVFLSANPAVALRYSNLIKKYSGFVNTGGGYQGGALQNSPGVEIAYAEALNGNLGLQQSKPAIGLSGKKFGFSFLRRFVGSKKAINIMLNLGAEPERYIKPALTGERHLIENFDDFFVDKDIAKATPLPHFYHRHTVYRGMSLNHESLNKILKEGLLVQDTKAASNTVGTIYMRRSQKAIFFSEDPSEAFFYAKLNLSDKKGIPVVVTRRGMNFFGADFGGCGIMTTEDIPFNEIKNISAMLNIDGKHMWGKIVVEDGKTYFMPYK